MHSSERIEQLKAQYTDQYVVADASRPELARFQGKVGQVKTVNWSGRALVQFEGQADHGWYDLEIEHLKIVDKPEPPAVPEKPPCKAACKPAAKTPPATE